MTGRAISRYNARSATVLLLLLAVGGVAALMWRQYVDFGQADPLLVGCWALMASLMCYRVAIAHDLRLAAVALAGGAFIEWWGTQSGLWTYFTHEKPPLFILPAWPAAALATHRIAMFLQPLADRMPLGRRGCSLAALITFAGFAAIFVPWVAPAVRHPITWAAALGVVVIVLTSVDGRGDLCRFVAGSLLGFLLERWGTTSGCWTYWSGGTPPLASVLAHGFATVGFARGVAAMRIGDLRWSTAGRP